MICVNTADVESTQVKKLNYQGKDAEVKHTWIRWLTHKNLGDEEYKHNHALRHFTVGPEGDIPMHAHEYTEIVYVLSGKSVFISAEKNGTIAEREIWPGDCIYTYSFEPHAIKNFSDSESAVFLCCIDCVGDKQNCVPSV